MDVCTPATLAGADIGCHCLVAGRLLTQISSHGFEFASLLTIHAPPSCRHVVGPPHVWTLLDGEMVVDEVRLKCMQ